MNTRIFDVVEAIRAVKAQFELAPTPMDKLEAYDRLQNLYVVLELECELAIDEGSLKSGVA